MTNFSFQQVSRTARAIALLLTFIVAGCSSFNREWRKAASVPVGANSIEGRWEGRWRSEANGHQGNLRCLMAQQTNDAYAARFRASYLGVLRFSYTVSLTVATQENGWRFHGQEDLGPMAGGVFHYAGTATTTNFYSTYRSSSDHGVFELKRRVPKK